MSAGMRTVVRAALLPVVTLVVAAACGDTRDVAGPEYDGQAQAARAPAAAARPAAGPTIVDVALSVNAESGEFSTLISAVLAAGLAEELSSVGQRTVFAPTDAAFAALGLDAASVANLPVDALRNILGYHVAPGRRLAADVVNARQIRMSNGGFTTVRVTSEGAYLNDSKIIATDIMTSNGVIHVIDAVLLP
jgi:uncharacterized surface protein with fasciclin (FAS1) repeats